MSVFPISSSTSVSVCLSELPLARKMSRSNEHFLLLQWSGTVTHFLYSPTLCLTVPVACFLRVWLAGWLASYTPTGVTGFDRLSNAVENRA